MRTKLYQHQGSYWSVFNYNFMATQIPALNKSQPTSSLSNIMQLSDLLSGLGLRIIWRSHAERIQKPDSQSPKLHHQQDYINNFTNVLN